MRIQLRLQRHALFWPTHINAGWYVVVLRRARGAGGCWSWWTADNTQTVSLGTGPSSRLARWCWLAFGSCFIIINIITYNTQKRVQKFSQKQNASSARRADSLLCLVRGTERVCVEGRLWGLSRLLWGTVKNARKFPHFLSIYTHWGGSRLPTPESAETRRASEREAYRSRPSTHRAGGGRGA